MKVLLPTRATILTLVRMESCKACGKKMMAEYLGVLECASCGHFQDHPLICVDHKEERR